MIFDDGESLDFTQIAQTVIAQTAGDDAIYGLANDNHFSALSANDNRRDWGVRPWMDDQRAA